MKVIVVGCGRMGSDLAYRLYKREHDVAVVDLDEKAFNALPPDFQGRFYEGDALNLDVLNRAGIQTCDAIAAVTNKDPLNLVVTHAARARFKVPHVVARNYDPRNRVLYEAFNVQTISAIAWAAQRLEELIYHSEVRTVFSAGNGEIEIYELTVPSLWDKQPLKRLNRCADCMVVSVTRGGRAFLPEETLVLSSGDILHLSASLDGIVAMQKRIATRPEEV
jgi:trk system potassium uptake protein TrkA